MNRNTVAPVVTFVLGVVLMTVFLLLLPSGGEAKTSLSSFKQCLDNKGYKVTSRGTDQAMLIPVYSAEPQIGIGDKVYFSVLKNRTEALKAYGRVQGSSALYLLSNGNNPKLVLGKVQTKNSLVVWPVTKDQAKEFIDCA